MRYQTVLITGVHTGLGNAVAQIFLDEGADVFAASRKAPERLKNAERLHFRSMDLSQTEAIRDSIRELLRSVKRLDLVLLNAGVLGEIKDLRDTSLKEIATILDINVWANKLIYDTLLDLQIAVPQLVAISSGAAFYGSGGLGAYSISKSALNLLFRVYSHEHSETHFNCLAPGVIQTQMVDRVLTLPSEVDDRYPAVERIRSTLGTDQMQTPTEAAHRLRAALPRLLEYSSGSYVDIREMEL